MFSKSLLMFTLGLIKSGSANQDYYANNRLYNSTANTSNVYPRQRRGGEGNKGDDGNRQTNGDQNQGNWNKQEGTYLGVCQNLARNVLKNRLFQTYSDSLWGLWCSIFHIVTNGFVKLARPYELGKLNL